MMMDNRLLNDRVSGFTVVEIIIVVIVIVLLAAVVFSETFGNGRRAKEAALRNNLLELRAALHQFNSDMGDWPANLQQLMADRTTPPTGKGGSGARLDHRCYEGPYLQTADGHLMKDPFTGVSDWVYNPAAGDIHSASTLTALNGTPYNTW